MDINKCRGMLRLENPLHMLVIVMLGVLFGGCGARPVEETPASLVGTWQGECEISLPVVFNPAQLPEDVVRTRQAVALTITIHEDATVAGSVGEAELAESVLKRNRGELGQRLNVASDYIVIDGYLSGPIVAGEDEAERKSFTIPFDLVDDQLRGGLMWRQGWKYPLPLCEVELDRQ
jgi:hypothetical protein